MFLFVFLMFTLFRKLDCRQCVHSAHDFDNDFTEKMKNRTSDCILLKPEGTSPSRWKFSPVFAREVVDCNGTLKILIIHDRVSGSYSDVWWKLSRSGPSKTVTIFGDFSLFLRCAADQIVSSRYREQNLLTSSTFDDQKQSRFSEFCHRSCDGAKFSHRSWAGTPFMNLSTWQTLMKS